MTEAAADREGQRSRKREDEIWDLISKVLESVSESVRLKMLDI